MAMTEEELARLPDGAVPHPYTGQRPRIDIDDDCVNGTAGWWAHMYYHTKHENGSAETIIAETAYFDTPEETVAAWNKMWEVTR